MTTRTRTRLALTAIATLVVASLATPATAKSDEVSPNPSDWLPKGYQVEKTFKIDLDQDGDQDQVVVGVDGPAIASEGTPDGDEKRALLVVENVDGKYRKWGIGLKALACRRCGGVINPGLIPPIDFTATKGSFAVVQSAGANEVTEWTHRYRLENKRIRLIGVDISDTDRNVGSTVTRSTNLLTGVTKTTVEGKPTKKVKAGTVKGKPRTVYLEAVALP